MTIEPVIGIQKKAATISEKEFSSFSIFSTSAMLREYFVQYGYHFIGFYYGNKDIIVVKDNNLEDAALTGDYNVYHAFCYRSGKIVEKRLSVVDALSNSLHLDEIKIYCFTHCIEASSKSMKLIQKSTSETVLEAESLVFIDNDKVLVNNFGVEGIFSISDNTYYPIVKQEVSIYSGKNPEQFVDMRDGMYVTFQNTIQPINVNNANLLEIVSLYPYGEKLGNKLRLLTYPIRYGIFYQNLDSTLTKWYGSKEERDKILEDLGILVEKTLEGNYVKVKNID